MISNSQSLPFDTLPMSPRNEQVVENSCVTKVARCVWWCMLWSHTILLTLFTIINVVRSSWDAFTTNSWVIKLYWTFSNSIEHGWGPSSKNQDTHQSYLRLKHNHMFYKTIITLLSLFDTIVHLTSSHEILCTPKISIERYMLLIWHWNQLQRP